MSHYCGHAIQLLTWRHKSHPLLATLVIARAWTSAHHDHLHHSAPPSPPPERLHNPGVLTSDPRIVDGAHPVPLLTFEEATELAFFGATVLHPLAMQPAQESGRLCVRVKNSYNRYSVASLTLRPASPNPPH